LAFTQAHNSKKYIRSQAAGTHDNSEYGMELYYGDQLTDAISIQPDFQYIKNPGTSKARNDAIVLGLRLNVGL
jgi:carbohydrate-selective porin OprB